MPLPANTMHQNSLFRRARRCAAATLASLSKKVLDGLDEPLRGLEVILLIEVGHAFVVAPPAGA